MCRCMLRRPISEGLLCHEKAVRNAYARASSSFPQGKRGFLVSFRYLCTQNPRALKTTVLFVGKTADALFERAISDYFQRVAHYMPAELVVLPDLRNTKSLSEAQQREREGEMLLARVRPGDALVLLDERGKELRSVELAAWLGKRQLAGRPLVFAIGGPYGFSPAVYARADDRLSLSRLTFSHQMVRLIFAEQLYRACTINAGEPYHHE